MTSSNVGLAILALSMLARQLLAGECWPSTAGGSNVGPLLAWPFNETLHLTIRALSSLRSVMLMLMLLMMMMMMMMMMMTMVMITI